MPVLTNNVRITLEVQDDDVVFIFPAHHAMKNSIRKLLKNRFIQDGRGNTRNMSYEARQAFFDDNCIGCEGLFIDDEGKVPLTPDSSIEDLRTQFPDSNVKVWTDLIPDNWKAEVSSQFEEMAVRARTKAEGE